jgi:hypothetical protein
MATVGCTSSRLGGRCSNVNGRGARTSPEVDALVCALVLQIVLAIVTTLFVPTGDSGIGAPIPFGRISFLFAVSPTPNPGERFVADIALTALGLWLIRLYAGDLGVLVATLGGLLSVALATVTYGSNSTPVGFPLPMASFEQPSANPGLLWTNCLLIAAAAGLAWSYLARRRF